MTTVKASFEPPAPRLTLKALGAALLVLSLASCSSDPKVTELSRTSDPQVELDKINSQITDGREAQLDILAPYNFDQAVQARDKAVEARTRNKDQATVLHRIAIAQSFLDEAEKAGKASSIVIKPIIDARHDALVAKAPSISPDAMKDADETFLRYTRRIEKGDTNAADDHKLALETTYRDIEIKAIKKERLGPAEAQIKQAITEDAKKLTPETLSWAQQKFAESDALISAQRHDAGEVARAQREANAASARLIKMVRSAKGSTSKNPEDLAKQKEASEIAAQQSAQDINKVSAELQTSQGQLAVSSAQNDKLKSQVWLDQEYEKARKDFDPQEAEVYKQGNRLVIRLKGLSFENNKSGISSNNFPLLAKVQKVIGDVGSSKVFVEGHTDSTGGPTLNQALSAKRAEAVQSYLIANKTVTADRIQSAGYGYTKPIATNKTPSGRAQNRRIDVIITSEPSSTN